MFCLVAVSLACFSVGGACVSDTPARIPGAVENRYGPYLAVQHWSGWWWAGVAVVACVVSRTGCVGFVGCGGLCAVGVGGVVACYDAGVALIVSASA